MTRFLIADDHPLFRSALIAALQPYFSDATFAEAEDFTTTIQILDLQSGIDIVLLDLHMPGIENLLGLIEIKEKHPDTPVVIVSAADDTQVIAQATALGASGFISKSTATGDFVKGILAVIKGEKWFPNTDCDELDSVVNDIGHIIEQIKGLTPKQLTVLSHLRAGMMNKQIAFEMQVSEATVKAHISAVFKKLGVANRTQAILLLDKFKL